MFTKDDFAAMGPLERVKAVDDVYGDKALLLSSMQQTSSVLMHLIYRAQAKTVILFVDTQYHFPETLATRDLFIEKYGLNIVTVYPEMTPEEQRHRYGDDLYKYADGQPQCCEIRKERPFLKYAREMHLRATMDGLMRAEGGARKAIEAADFDRRLNVPLYHPIFDFDYSSIEAYLKEHDVPVNPLHARGYPSIGCVPCTTPVAPGEDRRAGRWRHLRGKDGDGPQYCGINFSDLGEGI